MAVPKYYEFFPAVMECLKDGKTHTSKETIDFCAKYHRLTQEDLNEKMQSGQPLYSNRIAWARTYLYKAGLIEKPGRGVYSLTQEGRIVAKNGCEKVTYDFLTTYDSFNAFAKRTFNKKASTQDIIKEQNDDSPEEMLDTAVTKLNASLADDLLEEVMKISPFDFEKLVVDLLFKMGYGKPKDNNDAVTSKTGDEGIDGIVSADKFGFDAIYIQAKQWKTDSTVGRPEIQKFLGALAGQGATKGIFITTAQFSKEAKAFADKQLHSKIILVDGQDLAELMIEYNLGVSTNRVYEVKRIDTDYFNEYE